MQTLGNKSWRVRDRTPCGVWVTDTVFSRESSRRKTKPWVPSVDTAPPWQPCTEQGTRIALIGVSSALVLFICVTMVILHWLGLPLLGLSFLGFYERSLKVRLSALEKLRRCHNFFFFFLRYRGITNYRTYSSERKEKCEICNRSLIDVSSEIFQTTRIDRAFPLGNPFPFDLTPFMIFLQLW